MKIINKLYKIMIVFMIICFSISLIGAVFFYVNRSNNYLNSIVLIIGSILYLLALIRLYKFIQKQNKKTKNIILISLLIMQFILLFISYNLISSIPKVDLIHILTEINSLNDSGNILNNTYFSVYPNNRFLLILLYNIQKIPINNYILFGIISSLSISTMTIFTYKTVLKISNDNSALLSLFICVFSPIFYLYVSYYYTDILMLPFASILIYLIVKAKDESKKNIIYGILIGFISVIGYKIRPVCIFLLFAYLIIVLINKKNIIKKLLPLFISLVLTFMSINYLENLYFKNIDSSKQFPIAHWIMMGVNEKTNGYYSQDDYNLSFNTENIKERQKLNIDKIGERLKSQGLFKNVNLIFQKLIVIWGKGDYSYQKYLDLVKDYNISYNYLIEDRNILINYLLQFCKIGILILSIISLIKLYKLNRISFIAISLFFAISFYLIWEVCPRYGLSFLPWLIILSTYSYDSLNIDNNKFKYYKYLKYIAIVITVIVFAFGFNKYTSVNLKNDIISKSTSNKVRYVTLNKDTSIEQSLKLNNSFNQIKLKFRKNEEVDGESIFKLELYDESNLVYVKEFNYNDINDKKYTVFNLDKSYNSGRYFIKLKSSENSKVDIYVSYKEKYDYYPNGVLKIDNNEVEGDLSFEIINSNKRGTYKVLEYIIIFILTMFIEYILFFRKKEVNE